MEHAQVAEQSTSNVIHVDFANAKPKPHGRLSRSTAERFDEACCIQGVRISFNAFGDCLVTKDGRLTAVLVYSISEGNKFYVA